MAEGEGGFIMQYLYLLFLVMRMRFWKLLFWVLIGPALFLNHFILKDIDKPKEDQLNTIGITELKMKMVLSKKTLMPQGSKEQGSLLRLMAERNARSNDWIQTCKTIEDCKAELVKAAVTKSDTIASIINYGKKTLNELICFSTGMSPLLCPFAYHAMSQSIEYHKNPKKVFKEVTFAKYYDKYDSKSDSDMSIINISRPDSMCTRAVKSKFSEFLMAVHMSHLGHTIVVAATFVLYFTVATLSTISNLKENGFLQLVFNNGLSVSAFWAVYWTITMIEVLLFAAGATFSYALLCPGFFDDSAILDVFFVTVAFLLGIACLGFLCVTVVSSFFIVLLCMILIQVVLTVVLLVAKILVILQNGDKVGMLRMLLIFPPAHIVNYSFDKYFSFINEKMKPKKEFLPYFDSLASLIVVTPIVLLIVQIYLDFIVRNGNGLCLPWLYPFNPCFWNPHSQKLIEMVDDQPKRANVEPTVGVPAVIANDIFMTYPSGLFEANKPTILKGVTCTVYQGQITGLIGHNGAGKTTLIRVLMGEEIPTSGVAVINGHRVTDPYQRLALRGSVSICKQVDVLSNYLTVMESMKLTLVAKGFSVNSQVNKVLDMMKRLGLAGKENVQAMDLSGGQMRKVCSIICLLGNPKLVILDEPTSGLDPVSRRNLWQILQDHKAGRSIILCTQFMDEADILADRKMFLSAGKLICAGSSLFLKHAFGCCVTLSVTLKSEKYAEQVTKMLKKVKLVSQNQTELQLQVSADKPQILADAIVALEEAPNMVDAFGVSQAQLDDIFMRLKDIDMDNIEASFKSKKLRKLGRGGSGKVLVDRVDFSALYNFESAKPVRSTLITQFITLMGMNLQRQWKAKMKFCFRIIFPLLLVVGIYAVGLNAKMQEENSKNDKKKSIEEQMEDDAGNSKPVVVTPLNSEKLNIFKYGAGICIFDEEDGYTEEMGMQHCMQVFSLGGKGKKVGRPLMGVHYIAKKKTTTVSKAIQSADSKKKLRRLCPKSSSVTYACYYVYLSSWDPKEENSNRSVYFGTYENPADTPTSNSRMAAIQTSLYYYTTLATFFNSFNESLDRNFSVDSAKMASKFDDLEVQSLYELFIFLSAFALVPVTYLNDPIEDKDCGVRKHLASIGMSSMAYWCNTFILHWLHYFICFLLMAGACQVMDRYKSSFFFTCLVLPVSIVGTTVSQLSVYTISATMKKTNPVILVMYFFFAMFLSLAAGFFLDKPIMLYIFMCVVPPFPPVLLMMIGVKISLYAMLLSETKDVDSVPRLGEAFLSSEIVLSCFCLMPLHIVILVGLIIFIENPNILSALFAKKPGEVKHKPIKDEGVKIEADRIVKTVKNPLNMLEVRNLQKVYPNGVHAVRGTTFGTLSGEILGLLGPNGAGKSTSMSIIVGEEVQSGGTSEVHFSGTWMSGVEGALCGAIGYCPQHNPIFNSISVVEHLRFYASIRGLTGQLAQAQIVGLIDGLGLKPHQEKAAEQLSGGNKRRLCLAIALLGNPSLIVIDEASTGVDPENKRFIWAAIRGMANKHRSVIITTHSMEEVEALCARVGIMNKGLMIAFGTVQQLRSRHGEAYTLDVLMKTKKPQKLVAKKKKLLKKMGKHFPNSTLMEDLMRSVQFTIPRKSVPTFSGAMQWFITKKKKLGIQYFSLYQMSLDQVFVKLVKEYDES